MPSNRSTILKRLSADIIQQDHNVERKRLVKKWEKTGLLEGLSPDTTTKGMDRGRMALLMENTTKFLVKEASSMQAGDVEGFASVAFPIVRRVFSSLYANDLVAVQPVSLPTSLIFFLDFTHTDARVGYTAGESVYGAGIVGRQITGGVDLTDSGGGQSGFYNMANGYSSPVSQSLNVTVTVIASGTVGGALNGTADSTIVADINDFNKLARFDPDLSGSGAVLARIDASSLPNLNVDNLVPITFSSTLSSGAVQVMRLSQYNSTKSRVYLWFAASGTADAAINNLSGAVDGRTTGKTFQYNVKDSFIAGGALGSTVGSIPWALESQALSADGTFTHDVTGDIPEIDLKVDSISVTAVTKKYKAKWTPELSQDLNAYHSLDAEVELSNLLSELIGMEIDREILVDLLVGGKAGTLYWSRRPGKFLNRETGADLSSATAPPDFTGTISEWYESLLETVNDLSARIHRKLLRGGANFMVVSPEMASILEMTNGFRGNVTVDDDKGNAGSLKAGTLNNRWDVYVDPKFWRNVILVGRRGTQFLESGYVYAPYVPLMMTPTIFGPEDFVPRRGAMTRYAKKMIKPDFYGKVIVLDFLG